MERAAFFRRVVHCLLALAPVYFLLPEQLPVIGQGRWVLLIGFIAAVTALESVRLLMGWSFFGLRPHERNQIASFVWASTGAVVALWFFREDVATVAIIGMALVDPLAGELRRTRPDSTVSIWLSVLVYAAIGVVVFRVCGLMSAPAVLVVSAVGAVVAVSVERKKIRYIDDDFLMIVVPCAVMGLLAF